MKIKIDFVNIKSRGNKVKGMTLPSGKQIYIQKGMGIPNTLEVMIHELTHATLCLLKIKRSKKEHERIAKVVGQFAQREVWF